MNEDFWKTVEKYFGDMLDHFTRIDDLLRETNKKLDKLYEAILRLQLVKPTEAKLPPVTVEFPIDDGYDILSFDLSESRTDEPAGLRKRGLTVYNLTVLRCDGTAYIRLNSKANKQIECKPGLKISNFRIEEIYVTNSPASGFLEIFISWR